MLQFVSPDDLKDKKPTPRFRLIILALVLVCLFGVGAFLLIPPVQAPTSKTHEVTLDGNAMSPTYLKGSRLIYEPRLQYMQGDVIVFHDPQQQQERVRRVVATAGQTLQINSGVLFVNGVQVVEPYLATKSNRDFPIITVPVGAVFVLGDNRDNSLDSRDFGAVPLSNILGAIKG
ncbi:MAG: signal peptidase I [Chloroflexi bacterium]|uniref:Signal peptidase I n=1 Tax=Candidatus Chlorohelix allophototropha TaxID=3003348 RepID=A0A8T7LW11_9CHLR|nr:signal peptidase I [Chloroflexota bacterium]WJW66255.1 signal peptidase I [Chloroflexota bacterium L227-S17]